MKAQREAFIPFGLFRCVGCGVESGDFLHADCLTRQSVCSACFRKGVVLPPLEPSRTEAWREAAARAPFEHYPAF